MNTEEFSNSFDIATNAYLADGEVFDEFEKSFYLTRAQEQYVLQLYSSFEHKEIAKEILAPLVKTAVIKEEYTGVDENNNVVDELFSISDDSHFFELPNDLWLITYEEVVIAHKDKCLNNKRLTIAPTTQDKLAKIVKNPFKGPNTNRALRLNIANNIVEIICKYDIKRYFVRYIKKLNPIILTRLTDSTSINGQIERTECELHESIHSDILELAVAMALKSRASMQHPQQPQQQEQQQTE